jgi:hypothetical protein
MPQNDDHD